MIKIGNIELGKHTMVVAEIGNNHEGDFNIAKLLIKRAAESGVDAVKFQTIRADRIITRDQKERFDQIKSYEFSDSQFGELAALANANGLLFLSTPFDFESVDMLDELVPAFKVSSGDLNWYQFLEYIARKGKPILLSTGMSRLEEISRALEIIEASSSLTLNDQVVLLHCVSSYPADTSAANLLSIPYLKEKFRVPVGYSDHTFGILASETAVALGACVIEKHFTYRKEGQTFRDHALSADPADMKELIDNIRLIESSLGTYDKQIMECEKQNREIMRRSLAARKHLSRGDVIDEGAVTFLRPGTGIIPERLSSIIGRRVVRDVDEGMILREEDLE